MKLRVMEFYIHFYIRESGIKISWWWQCNLNISSFMSPEDFTFMQKFYEATFIYHLRT